MREFFIDINYKIIPANFRPYKLLVISGLPESIEKTKLLVFVSLIYLDNIIYDKLFNYLVENFNLMPNIIHTDFEKAFHI